MRATKLQAGDVFAQADELFEGIEAWLTSDEAATITHSELEDRLTVDGRELMRELFQGYAHLRAIREQRLAEVTDKDGAQHTHVDEDSERGLTTVFGPVRIPRFAYGGRQLSDLHPSDAVLNLPKEKHSHGLRRESAEEVAKGSYDNADAAIGRHTGGRVRKRQIEELVMRAAQDFDAFYPRLPVSLSERFTTDLLVLTSDGKGIVMLREYLREATQQAATESEQKLGLRTSKGEKKNRKRMATVAAVYTVAPFVRTPDEVMSDLKPLRVAVKKRRPRAREKRVWASVEKDAETVIAEVFDEAERRDPKHRRRWVYLVDGENHQLRDGRGQAPKGRFDHRARFHPRPRIPVEGGLVLLRRG